MHSPNPSTFPRSSSKSLFTKRFCLQPIGWEDVEDVYRLHNYPEVEEFNNLSKPESLEATKDLLRPLIEEPFRPDQHLAWTIRLADNTQFRGTIGLQMRTNQPRVGEIYYEIEPPYWGKGIATECVQEVLRFGFEQIGLLQIRALTAKLNVRSIRVLEKVGMQNLGFRTSILPARGIWQENYEFMLDSSHFLQQNQ